MKLEVIIGELKLFERERVLMETRVLGIVT